MEEMKKEVYPACACSAGMCKGMHGCGRFWVLRWLLALAILAIVFGLGEMIGEFRGSFESDGYGGGRMQYGREMMYDRQNRVYNVSPMMTQPTTITVPTIQK